MVLHIKKLCVGLSTLDELRAWQARAAAPNPEGRPVVTHVTRSHPRRAAEIIEGGSLYWVVAGRILCRNRILAFEEIEGEAARNQRGRNAHKRQCVIHLAAGPVPVMPVRHRPFQGWRYLEAEAAPPDLPQGETAAADLPPELVAELRELGLL